MIELIAYFGVLLLILFVGGWLLGPDEGVATDLLVLGILWPVVLPLVLVLFLVALLVQLVVVVGRRHSRVV